MKTLYKNIIALVLIIILSVTTVFAWISLATVNSIRDITLTATSGKLLEMSLDGINYYQKIPSEILLEKSKYIAFKDVTSFDNLIFKKNFNSFVLAQKNKDYLSIDFYFRTTSQYIELHLSDNYVDTNYGDLPKEGTYISSSGINWESDVEFKYSEDRTINIGEVDRFYASDAMRVGIYNEDDNINKIFDLSENEERGYGKIYGAHDYLSKLLNKPLNIPTIKPDTIYEFSKFSSTDPIAITNSSHIATLTKTEDKDDKDHFYYKSKITMNVWIEGWDADAFDAIYQDQFKMQFMFRAVMPKIN